LNAAPGAVSRAAFGDGALARPTPVSTVQRIDAHHIDPDPAPLASGFPGRAAFDDAEINRPAELRIQSPLQSLRSQAIREPNDPCRRTALASSSAGIPSRTSGAIGMASICVTLDTGVIAGADRHSFLCR